MLLFALRYPLAGVPGFEPGLSVLETDVLTVDTIPLCRFPIADLQLPIARAVVTSIGNRKLAIGNTISFLCDQCVGGNGDRTC